MQEFVFESRDEASLAAASQIEAALLRRLAAQDEASLVVSGGSSPVRCFEALSGAALDWSGVHVVLSDERWLPPDHADSNEKLVRETLLTGPAAAATLHGYYDADMTAAARCAEMADELSDLPFPFACALLGMGADGHFASLFPDADNLRAGLDSESADICLPVSTAASPYERITLTLAALSRSDEIVLLAFGDDKWQVLQAAKSSANGYPVAKLLKQKRAPISIYWAP